MIEQKITMWGNSLGIRLPKTITEQVNLHEGGIVRISIEGNNIVLSPARPKYTLDELLKDVNPETQHDEVNWGQAMGEENW